MKKQVVLRGILVFGLILGIRDGGLALEQDGNVVETYPCPVVLLPEADRQMLEAGIPIVGDTALAGILEDYLS